MNGKIIDFQAGKDSQLHKRKEAKLDSMRQAFKLARGEISKLAKAKKPRKPKK